MKSIVYNFSIPNYVKTRAAARSPFGILESGRVPGLALQETEPLPLRSEEWLRLKPLLAGICGSDMSMLANSSGPSLTPFFSYPLVPGHEVVAEVIETGASVSHMQAGQRVVLNPVIGCDMRGLPLCVSCARGATGLCMNAAEGELSPGMLTGFCRDLPGGWSEGIIAHRSQVFAVPDEISTETAVLIEPFSVALHAVLRTPPPETGKVMILGSGSIGLLTLASLRRLGHDTDVTVLARHPAQAELATRFGATRVLRGATPGEAAEQVARARKYKPIIGPPVYTGGFDLIYDCVGSRDSVDQSLRVTAPNGQIALIGCAAEMRKLDLTFAWAHELTVRGSYIYGAEVSLPGEPHTFDLAMKLLQEQPNPPLSDLITHMYPLAAWRDAIATSFARGKRSAIKVVFDCR